MASSCPTAVPYPLRASQRAVQRHGEAPVPGSNEKQIRKRKAAGVRAVICGGCSCGDGSRFECAAVPMLRRRGHALCRRADEVIIG